MTYRTRTYIAGEWDGDSDAIGQIYSWNEGNKWSLDFVDAHKNKQCYDSSMPCTIKSSLFERMGRSKNLFLLLGAIPSQPAKDLVHIKIVGTNSITIFLDNIPVV